MKLLTRKIERTLPLPSELKGVLRSEIKIYAHFFNPVGEGDWFIMAGERNKNDFNFFGIQILDEFSVGYFSLRDLESIKLPFGEKIRRSEHFEIITLSELKENLHLILD